MSDNGPSSPADPAPQGQGQAPGPNEASAQTESPDVVNLGDDIGVDQLKAIIAALQADVDASAAELAEKHDMLLRAVAETDNVRRRLEKEKSETAKYAISKFAKDILSVGDNFQRAIDAVPKEAIDTDPALKSLLDGVVLAERDFRGALERHGVQSIDPAGEAFNPHHHQAVMEQDNTSVPSGTVLQVYQTGYLIDDRCLRPAMVVVSRGGPKAVKATETSTSDKGAGPQSTNSEPHAPETTGEQPTAADPEQS